MDLITYVFASTERYEISVVVSGFNIDRFKWIYVIWGYRRAEKLFA
jgi:hypothetical protein